MNKKTIICIACVVMVALVIAVAIYCAIIAQKTNNSESKQKIIITKYDENFKVEKVIEVTNKKDIKRINQIAKNLSLDNHYKYAIVNNIKVDLGNGRYFMIQLDLPEYCYYEDPSSNTKIVTEMPEGLLDRVNEVLENN